MVLDLADRLAAAGEGGAFAPALYRFLSGTVEDWHRSRPGERLDAAALCRAFRDRAGAEFGPLAPWVGGRWGVRAGEDLGRALDLLVRAGALRWEDGDGMEEYRHAGAIFPG